VSEATTVLSCALLTSSRTKAKKAHPDVGGSQEQMAALNEAYEVLNNEGESGDVA